jgi:hypothetical protein
MVAVHAGGEFETRCITIGYLMFLNESLLVPAVQQPV